jgi:hypothetical protein
MVVNAPSRLYPGLSEWRRIPKSLAALNCACRLHIEPTRRRYRGFEFKITASGKLESRRRFTFHLAPTPSNRAAIKLFRRRYSDYDLFLQSTGAKTPSPSLAFPASPYAQSSRRHESRRSLSHQHVSSFGRRGGEGRGEGIGGDAENLVEARQRELERSSSRGIPRDGLRTGN